MDICLAQAILKNEFNVSRETIECLETYVRLLKQWNPKINLVSRSTLDFAWERHILDSAQVWNHMSADTEGWADIGSGGGFPGMVLAILARDSSEIPPFTLVESDLRKCAFLSTVSRETGVRVAVRAERIENYDGPRVDRLTARALAPLPTLLGFSEKLLTPDGVSVFLKGRGYDSEVESAQAMWGFDLNIVDSRTSKDGKLLIIRNLRRA